ncbi:hypothetical protein YC2023_070567 [Brassica napus]
MSPVLWKCCCSFNWNWNYSDTILPKLVWNACNRNRIPVTNKGITGWNDGKKTVTTFCQNHIPIKSIWTKLQDFVQKANEIHKSHNVQNVSNCWLRSTLAGHTR